SSGASGRRVRRSVFKGTKPSAGLRGFDDRLAGFVRGLGSRTLVMAVWQHRIVCAGPETEGTRRWRSPAGQRKRYTIVGLPWLTQRCRRRSVSGKTRTGAPTWIGNLWPDAHLAGVTS